MPRQLVLAISLLIDATSAGDKAEQVKVQGISRLPQGAWSKRIGLRLG